MKKLRFVFLSSLFVLLTACGGPAPTTSEPTIQPPQPLSTAKDSTSFLIENTSDSSLAFNITVQNAAGNPQPGDWFTVDPKSGTIAANEQRSITLTLQPNLKAGTYTSTLTINYPGGSTPFDITGTVGGAAAGGFTLEIDNTFTNSLPPGAEVRVPVTIKRNGGFTGEVTLEVFGAPDGVSGTFTPNPASGSESTLVVTTQNSVAAGMYSLSVRGKSGSLSATAKVDVNVVGTTTEPTFSLALSPASLSTEAGKTVTSTVTVNKTSSFSSNVSLSVSGAPNGVTVSFDPATTNSTAKVNVEVGGGVAAGNYTLTIRGSGGGKTGNTKLGLTVLGKAAGTGRITGTARTDNAKISLTPTPVTKTAPRDLEANLQRPAYVPGQLLVQYRDGLALQADLRLQADSEKTQVEAVQEAYGLTLLRAATSNLPSLVRVAVGENLEAVAKRLERDPRVAYAEPNYYIYAQSVPNDPETGKLWNMPVSGLPVAWSLKNSASNVTVAVLDTGIQTSHTDLQGIFVSGYDFCAASACAQTDTNPQPDSTDDAHGTHVTGTLAAVGNNGKGVAGVLYGGAKIVPVKVFYQASFTTADALAQAIRWAAGETVRTTDGKTATNPNPAKIINLSLGTEQQSTTLENAVKAAQAKGALLVAAAGNVGGSSLFYPARYSGVLAVGAVNSDFRRSCFSNYGSGLDIMAAGGDGFLGIQACQGRNNEAILSTYPGNAYNYEAGTSMATPVVAGVAALLLSETPSLSAAQLTDRLKKSAYFDDATMSADQYGAGVVRADLAFGFPGPGDRVSVSASGAGSAVATPTLKLNGESTPFTLDTLAAGSYTLEANASGSKRSLSATQTVNLAAGENKTVTLQLKP